MRIAVRCILFAFAICCCAGPILTFTSGNFATHAYDQTIGWRFTVNSTITLNELYWYDPDSIFNKAFPVAIWDDAGNVVLSPTDVGFGAGTWDGAAQYWFTPVTPVTLNAGTISVIGGLIAPVDRIIDQASGVATDPAITFIEAMAGIGGNLRMPGGGQGLGAGYLGPNFGIATVSDVPEPATWTLLTIGLCSLAVSRRRSGRH